MKDSKPSRADVRALRKAIAILEEYERQQRTNPQPISHAATFAASQARSSIATFIRAFD